MAPLTLHSPQARITRLGSIVRGLRRLGFETPADIEAELKIVEIQSTAAGDAAAALRVARDNLSSVPADEFDSAVAEFDKASIRAFATQNGDANLIREVTAGRLESAILSHYGEWMGQIVKGYNEVVESNDLNRHGRNLPDLTSKHLRVLDISSTQTAAIEAWKAAEPTLSSYWGMYVRLAELRGIDRIGPKTVDAAGTNMWLACILGEPNWSQAESAAVVMASVAAGSSASAEVRKLVPHIIPSIVGYDLNLTTPGDAGQRRSSIQRGATGYTAQLGMSYQ
ncbi:Uncharacterised protein [Mycobacteroides abscessus subsp. massiliense]|nr:hypothetical protein [Mycobacteroides abscessus]EIU16242.1 hypothetical protein MA5S0304_0507 [Mycobacteroides abscessus 5S-0304]SKU69584.1 Uncharacterised protein [Mycobacteroides abscessus subsp. massiliense]SKU77311.1 Uncharacterised protein [Mycobacteroides abscessus subsp. massiliense]